LLKAASSYFRFLDPFSRWESAEPAAVLDALLVRLSRRTFEAAFAAFLPVAFLAMIKLQSIDH
jgi:hypothetical protein